MPRVIKNVVTPKPNIKNLEDLEYAELCRVLGENIRRERRSRGFSIQDIAKYLELSTSYVGLLERGARCPSLKIFFSLCSLFSVSPNELTTDRNAGVKKVAERGYKPDNKNHYDAIQSLLKHLDEKELEFIAQMLKSLKELNRDK